LFSGYEMDTEWGDLEEECKYAPRLEAAGQGERGETTGGVGRRTGEKKLGDTSANLGRRRRKSLNWVVLGWKILPVVMVLSRRMM
jgi:hypothetical protein